VTLDERLTAWLGQNYQDVFHATILRRYDTEEEQRSSGDVRVATEHGERNIEEKASGVAEERWLDDCLLELIQAAEGAWEERKTRGWFYDLHNCDFLLNGYFYPSDSATPSVVRILRWKKTRDAALRMIRDGAQLRTHWVRKGFGLTLCMYVPYSSLRDCIAAEWAVDDKYLLAKVA